MADMPGMVDTMVGFRAMPVPQSVIRTATTVRCWPRSRTRRRWCSKPSRCRWRPRRRWRQPHPAWHGCTRTDWARADRRASADLATPPGTRRAAPPSHSAPWSHAMSIPFCPVIRSSCLCLAIAAALASPVALALEAAAPDTTSDATRTVDFEALVVTAAAPVSALTWETSPKLPRQPVPASDGADYLKTIPGFSSVRNGGSNGDPVLRGMFGSRLNLLTNDGAMPGACPSRMDNAMSYISPETYDALVVTKGPQTVLWGPGASAGTVRFERDREYYADPAWKFAASALGGSWGRNDQVLDATYGAPLGYVRVGANRSESGDYDDGNGDRVGSAWK